MTIADDLAAAAIDAVFSIWGKAASYQAPGGPPAPCCVILDVRDISARPEDGSPPAGQSTLEVRAFEVAAPKSGGVFTIQATGKTFEVANRPMPGDGDGYAWKMWVE